MNCRVSGGKGNFARQRWKSQHSIPEIILLVALERCCAPGVYPLRLCLFVSTLSPAVVEALGDRAMLRAAAAAASFLLQQQSLLK